MIKVYKSDKAPEKLAEAGYTCDEVKQAILNDQKDKCYLCERKVTTDYQVEHIVSRTNNKEKVNEWENLFLACNYCNDRKKHYYDDIPLPNQLEFENVISQTINLKTQKADFRISEINPQLTKLKELLDKLFNGKGICRNLMENRFWNDFMSVYRNFLRRVAAYKIDPTEENKQLVIEELSIEQSALGFKYAFLNRDAELWSEFQDYCKWNK